VGATISLAAGIFGRTVVKYGDRGVRYVYIAAARPVCWIMGVLRGWCCRRNFAFAGLGRVRRVGMFGTGRESSSMVFSGSGHIRVIRCRKCSIRLRFTGKL